MSCHIISHIIDMSFTSGCDDQREICHNYFFPPDLLQLERRVVRDALYIVKLSDKYLTIFPRAQMF